MASKMESEGGEMLPLFGTSFIDRGAEVISAGLLKLPRLERRPASIALPCMLLLSQAATPLVIAGGDHDMGSAATDFDTAFNRPVAAATAAPPLPVQPPKPVETPKPQPTPEPPTPSPTPDLPKPTPVTPALLTTASNVSVDTLSWITHPANRIGMHGSPNDNHNSGDEIRSVISAFASRGVDMKSFKLLSQRDSALGAATAVVGAGGLPVVREYLKTPGPRRLTPDELNALLKFTNLPVEWLNEINLNSENPGGSIQSCADLGRLMAQSWVPDALALMAGSVRPTVPALSEGGDCPDLQVEDNFFATLSQMQIDLPDGSKGTGLDLFNPDKTKRQNAWIALHDYSKNLRHFLAVRQVVQKYIPYKVPYVVTEGGPGGGPSRPSDLNELKQLLNSSQYPELIMFYLWVLTPSFNNQFSQDAYMDTSLSQFIDDASVAALR